MHGLAASESSTRRPLGGQETWFAAQHEAIGVQQITTMATLQPPASVGAVRAAARELQQAHAMLRACFVIDGGKIFLDCEVGGPVDVRSYEVSLDEAFRAELEDPLEPEVCGWRVALCGPHLFLTYHHAFMDGRGIMVVLEDLLGLLDRRTLEPPAVAAQGLGNTFEEDVPWPRTPVEPEPRLAPALGRCLTVLPDMVVPGYQRQQRWTCRRLPVAVGTRLLEQCRAHGTSAQGALGAATAIAMSSVFGGPPAVKMLLGVDCRKSCGRPARSLACCAQSISSAVPTDLPFWEVAREHKQDIVDRLAMQEHLPLVSPLARLYTRRYEDVLDSALMSARLVPVDRNLIQFSNRGVYRLSTKSHSVSEVQFVQFGAPDIRHALFFVNACTVDGCLCLTLCYDNPATSDCTASSLADAILAQLMAASAPTAPSRGPSALADEGEGKLTWEMLDDMLPADVGAGLRCVSSSNVTDTEAARKLAEGFRDCVGFACAKDATDFRFKRRRTGFSARTLARPCRGWQWHYIAERAGSADSPDSLRGDVASAAAGAGEEALWPSGTGRGAVPFKYRHVGQEFSAVGWFEQEEDGSILTWTSRTGSPENPSSWRPRNTWNGMELAGNSIGDDQHSCELERNDAGVVTVVTWRGGFQWRLFDV